MQLIIIKQLAIYAFGTIVTNELLFWDFKNKLSQHYDDRDAYFRDAGMRVFLLGSALHLLIYIAALRGCHR
jgi:hypothetical protein